MLTKRDGNASLSPSTLTQLLIASVALLMTACGGGTDAAPTTSQTAGVSCSSCSASQHPRSVSAEGRAPLTYRGG